MNPLCRLRKDECQSFAQSELEHRTSKARYQRTDHKDYVQQMTHIERRQHRLRQMREMHGIEHEDVPKTLEPHHHIGASESAYEYMGLFLRQRSGDPAVKVSSPK